MSKKERLAAAAAKRREDPGQQEKSGASKPTMVKTDRKVRKEEMEVTEEKDKPGKGSGKKDACYHKVKSRYSVWPSAYASGALVKCRKVGAANWGNKSESVEFSNWRDDFKPVEYEFTDLIKPEPIKVIEEGKKKGLWDNIHAKRKRGEKPAKPGEKGYPETLDVEEGAIPDAIDPKAHRKQQRAAKIRTLAKKGSTEGERAAAEKKTKGPKMFGEEESKIGGGNLKKLATKATKRIDTDVDGDVDSKDMKSGETGEFVPGPDGKKVKPKVRFEHSDWRLEFDEGAAWTKKSGKSESGGLNEKGRKSYERENPGSDLKAPSKKVGNPRRKSFCARMKGMKKKLTSKKTASDPDSRINKSLRAWNC